MIKAVLWDFGGVILSSPFEAFNKYEAEHDLPTDFLRTINATNPHENAWARLERSDISAMEFDTEFANESEAAGHRVPGADVLAILAGDVRDEMVALLDELKASGYRLACLTNNIGGQHSSNERSETIAAIMARFDVVVESSKIGVRKPEVQFYETACNLLGVDPSECVFLDDLGVNLKPAAEMGMTTIKVISAAQAIRDLHLVLGN
ncbi:MAG: putative hydrolase [Ilumatobacteraceae bacterium]|nr:putative hydrolase [Ilumatobacteraceae bacterium]